MIRLEDIPELSAGEADDLMKEFENLIDVSGISYIETLLSTSSFDHDYRERILRELPEMDLERSYEVIRMLQMNQLNPDQGNLGNQKQTAKHIKSIAQ